MRAWTLTISGLSPNGPRITTSEIKVALVDFVSALEAKGHKLETGFINDNPVNLQDPKEKEAALREAAGEEENEAPPKNEPSRTQVIANAPTRPGETLTTKRV